MGIRQEVSISQLLNSQGLYELIKMEGDFQLRYERVIARRLNVSSGSIRELCLREKTLSAEEAFEINLFQRIIDFDKLLSS